MRITNKIMQNNSLSNVNTNKILQDKLSTQLETRKKISRPSQDPVIAIRALRLRGNVTEITQYYEKNMRDGESWLDATDSALNSLTDVLEDMYKLCEKGANGPNTSSDRAAILSGLRGRADEVYTTGDADYAGRYLFTGYRTNIPLSFGKAQTLSYTITEQLGKSALENVTKVDGGGVETLNEGNYAATPVVEQDVSSYTVHRIRLAYANCDSAYAPTVNIMGGGSWTANVISKNANPDPYQQMAAGAAGDVVFIPETGELLLSDTVYNAISQATDNPSTPAVNEAEVRVAYKKESWVGTDLRPEHYFACEAGGTIYNAEYLADSSKERQAIEYDVGFNQTIRVNSTADECFSHAISRDAQDLIARLEAVQKLEGIKADITRWKQTDLANSGLLEKQLDAINKALTLEREELQRGLERGMTKMKNHLNAAALAQTACGNRGSKLELIKNRSQEQKTTFETLASDNEDVDMTEAAIRFKAADVSYEASLMATGKLVKRTLLDYI